MFTDLGGIDRRGRAEPRVARHAPRPSLAADLSRWVDHAPTLECDWEPLKIAYQRSLVDLAALRFSPLSAGRHTLPAAGLPWFMTMFGRDSIITSLQALPFTPDLAATTLRELGAPAGHANRRLPRRGPGTDPARDALRRADRVRRAAALALLRLGRRDPAVRRAARRVRAVDGRHEARPRPRVRGPGGAGVDRRRSATSRATATSRTRRATPTPGSPTSAGRTRPTRSPTATARCPGFRARHASCRATPTTPRCAAPAWHARSGTTTQYADALERQAADLKRRFNRDFWVADGEYFAVAIEPDGRKVDSLTSNIGHLLWSGIVDKSKAKAIARHLTGERLYSGWGVRTLAVGEARYNPIGYHVGTVWPFDNSLIALGLRRYGFKDEAACIAAGILEATQFFEGRLPEAFAGYPRTMTKYPVQYPTACSPQAWSSGAPLMLLTAMLGLEPHGDHLVVDPALPSTIGRIELLDIPGRWGRLDAFGRGRVELGKRRRRRS